jgi:hypothetical protein
MKKQVRRYFFAWGRVFVFAGCAAISAFVLLSGYESIYNRSMPFVHTLDPVTLTAFQASYDLPTTAEPNTKLYGNFGKPSTVKMPASSLRLNVAGPVQDKDGWLARANSLHLLITKPPRNGNIGMALLYCRSSFRTIQPADLPKPGQNIFVDTDQDWRYVYRVTNASTYDDSAAYIPTDDGTRGKLVIACNDTKQHISNIIEADLISVQGVEQ